MKSWGSDIIPKETWIDPKKTYRTRSGYEVCGLEIVMKNSCGNEVTYPVKGSIIRPRKKPKFRIWSLDGRANIFQEEHPHDLMEVL